MSHEEKPCDIADSRGARSDKTFDAEERLMLLRRQAFPPRCCLAESEEAPYLEPKLSKRFVVHVPHFPGHFCSSRHPWRRAPCLPLQLHHVVLTAFRPSSPPESPEYLQPTKIGAKTKL